jgi:8-oxo-dGTP diphosphatase
MSERPKVGIGVLIFNNGKILLGKRSGSHGEGSWSPPGGHLEFGEKLEECAKREVKEEAGIDIRDVEFTGHITNDVFKKEGKHYITIHMEGTYCGGTLNTNLNEYTAMELFEWNNLPKPLFLPFKNLVKSEYNPVKKK